MCSFTSNGQFWNTSLWSFESFMNHSFEPVKNHMILIKEASLRFRNSPLCVNLCLISYISFRYFNATKHLQLVCEMCFIDVIDCIYFILMSRCYQRVFRELQISESLYHTTDSVSKVSPVTKEEMHWHHFLSEHSHSAGLWQKSLLQ